MLELEVGKQLCGMIGFDVKESWGHLTCDGSVANGEAVWAARNLKFYPLSLQLALQHSQSLKAAMGLMVPLFGQTVSFLSLSTWQLLNLDADLVLQLSTTLQEKFNIDTATLTAALLPYSVQNLGYAEIVMQYLLPAQPTIKSPVMFAPATAHYSWPKAAALTGMGAAAMRYVPVDVHARMDMGLLEKMLRDAIAEHRPIAAVVAVMGTTEQGSIDPLADILKLRASLYEKDHVYFPILVDGAWGGYYMTLIEKHPPLLKTMARVEAPKSPLSDYVLAQLRCLSKVETVTIDPHKSGYVVYPAGSLSYRIKAMRSLISFSAPVVTHDDAPDVTVGIYGIEGSKPGAAAAAVYLSHSIFRIEEKPEANGMAKILQQCLFTVRRLYTQLTCREWKGKQLTLQTMESVPATVDMKELRRIAGLPNQQWSAADMQLIRQVGQDGSICTYWFNFYDQHGQLNGDVSKMNALNSRIFDACRVSPNDTFDSLLQRQLILTSTDFAPDTYGDHFLAPLWKKSGIATPGDSSLSVLLTTVMNPWSSEETAEAGLITFLDQLVTALEGVAVKAREEILKQ